MNKNHKNALIGALLAVVFVMAVGYALFAQQLTIKGQAEITSTWDVKITDISVDGDSIFGAASDTTVPSPGAAVTTSTTSYQGTMASFKAVLTSPSDSITYVVTVSNNGSIPAALESSGWVVTTPAYNAAPIIFSNTDAPATIPAGESRTFTVTVTYDDSTFTQQPSSDLLSKNATFNMNYVQVS